MAKIDSTAVNELIDLVSQQPLPSDGTDDLMFSPPPLQKEQLAPPFPRTRAPQSTQPPLPVAARPRTATTPPPTPMPAMAPTPMPAMATPSLPAMATPSRQMAVPSLPPPTPSVARRTTLPPPRPTGAIPSQIRAEGTPAPQLISQAAELAAPRRATTIPPSMPVAAPFEARPRTPTPAPAPVAADDWSLPDGGEPELIPQPPIVAADATPTPVPNIVLSPSMISEYPKPPAHRQTMGAPVPAIQAPQDMTSNQAWFDVSMAEDADQEGVGTMQVAKLRGKGSLTNKLMIPAGVLAVAGVFIGGYFAFKTDRPAAPAQVAQAPQPVTAPAPTATPITAPVAVAAPVAAVVAPAEAQPAAAPAPVAAAPVVAAPVVAQPAPASAPVAAAPVAAAPVAVAAQPTAAPIETPVAPAAPTTIDVRIDSTPSGATVMLVDQGRTSFLGVTPVNATVDPARKYDLVFTLAGTPTQIAPLDPSATHHMSVTLGKHAHVTAEPAIAAAPAHREETPHAAPVHHAEAAPVHHEESHPAPAKHVATAEAPKKAGGQGVLMISSKPPTEIYIDGKATGLRTPQRSIPLALGAHKITLVDIGAKIHKTVNVDITPGAPTKVIQNLMQ